VYFIPNTFGLSCKASEIAEIEVTDSQERIAKARSLGRAVIVVGAGSNILFADSEINALILRMSERTISYENDPNDLDTKTVTASAGVIWHELVMDTLKQNSYGLENLSLIPGTVGAAPIQNIGAYGVEVGDMIGRVSCVDLRSAENVSFSQAQCQFGYRDSVFKQNYKDQLCIKSVQFRLSKIPKISSGYESLAQQLQGRDPSTLKPRDISDAVIAVRRNRLPDPAIVGNAGSFFKNPSIDRKSFETLVARYPNMPHYPQKNGGVKLAAGWLIEQSGLKGMKRGRAGTHEKQALVVVNHGGATGAELIAVAREVKSTVADKFDITLEHEVRILDRNGLDISL
jgi:UDP-N-acetylmuramate dehydrogenase